MKNTKLLLPQEVLIHILFFCDRATLLCRVATVSKDFRGLALNKRIWWHHTFHQNPYFKSSTENIERACCFYSIFNVACSKSPDRVFDWEVLMPEKQQPHEDENFIFDPIAYYLEQQMIERSCTLEQQQLFYRDWSAEKNLDQYARGGYERGLDSFKIESGGKEPPHLNTTINNKVHKVAHTIQSQDLPFHRHRHTMISCVLPQDSTIETNQQRTASNRSIVVIGGLSSTSLQDSIPEQEVYIFNPNQELFTNKRVQGKPNKIGKHCACLHGEKNDQSGKIIVFGGSYENRDVTNEMYEFDPRSNSMIPVAMKGDIPIPRCNHRGIRIGQDMYVIGGTVGDNMTPTNDVYAFNLVTKTWRRVKVVNSSVFSPRIGFTVEKIGRHIIVFGGAEWTPRSPGQGSWTRKYHDTFLFDNETATWTKLQTTGATPEISSFPTCTRVGCHLYVFSGSKLTSVSSDIYVLDLVRYHWHKMLHVSNYEADGLSCQQYAKTVISSDTNTSLQNKLLVFGGYKYSPICQYSIFHIAWKDILDGLGKQSIKYTCVS